MGEKIPKVVTQDLLVVLKRAQRYINNGDIKKLKNLSDHAANNTSIFQNSDSLALAVLVYALSKLLERWGTEGEYAEQARNLLSSAYFHLEKEDMVAYRDEIRKLVDFTSVVEKQFKLYVEKVMEKAQIKKGSRLYETGISVARSADLLGIGQWELMNYIGKTRIHDEVRKESDVSQRLKFTRSLFAK